ncbi:MAG: hypothetical protein WAT91_17875, partial [Saprospiraceae bacterium]
MIKWRARLFFCPFEILIFDLKISLPCVLRNPGVNDTKCPGVFVAMFRRNELNNTQGREFFPEKQRNQEEEQREEKFEGAEEAEKSKRQKK